MVDTHSEATAPSTAPGLQPRETTRRSQRSPSMAGRGYGICPPFDGDGPGLPQRVLPREGEGRVRAVQGEGVVDALPLVQGGRTPEPQPRALRPAEGADADVKGGGRSERDGCPVAGDGESLDEEPPPSTGSVTSKSISSRQWSSASAAWGTATAAARATAAAIARKLFGGLLCRDLRLPSPLPFPLMLSLSVRLGLPNQR